MGCHKLVDEGIRIVELQGGHLVAEDIQEVVCKQAEDKGNQNHYGGCIQVIYCICKRVFIEDRVVPAELSGEEPTRI